MNRRVFPLIVLLTLATAGALAADNKWNIEDPAEWVPEDALIYLGVTDVERTYADFQKTATYQLFSDEALTKAATELKAVTLFVEEFQTRLAKLVDVPTKELKSPFAGPLALFAVPSANPTKEFKLEVCLIAGVGDKELLDKYYTSIVTRLKDYGRVENTDVAGTAADIFTRKDDTSADDETNGDEDEFDFESGDELSPEAISKAFDDLFNTDALPEHLALARTDDRFIIATSDDALRLGLRPGNRTLADADDHKAFLRTLRRPGTIHFLVNLPKLIEVARATVPESDAETLRTTLQVIGAEGLRSLVGHVKLGASSYDSKSEVLVLMSGQRSGLAEMLSMDNRPTTPPPSVDADTALYASLNLNVSKLLDQVERMVRQQDPQAADQMRQAIEQAPLGAKSVNLRQDLFQYLRGPITVAVSIAEPITAEAVHSHVALGLTDQQAIVRFISSIGLFAPQDIHGTQVFTSMLGPGIGIAPLTDRLVLGAMPVVQNLLNGESSATLAQTNGWRQAARFVPDEAWFTLYLDNRRLMEAAAKLADDPSAGMAVDSDFGLALLGQFYGEAMSDMQSASETVKQKLFDYTGSQIITVSTTPEGVLFTAVELKPEK